MTEQHLEDALEDARDRLRAFETFLQQSDELAPEGDLEYALELYSAWVLLAYAAHESALNGLGRATMLILASTATTPDSLPEPIRGAHLKRTIAFANELTGVSASKRATGIDPESLLRRAYGPEWAEDSILMRLDRNAWPDRVREWLDRVGVDRETLRWMKEPYGGGSETLESIVTQLVEERNALAHGVRPATVRSAEAMRAWCDAIMEFARRTSASLQIALAAGLGLELLTIGDRAAMDLGSQTAAFETLAVGMRVGGSIICRDTAGILHSARVLSMQSDDVSLDSAAPGQQRVAITINRQVADIELLRPI